MFSFEDSNEGYQITVKKEEEGERLDSFLGRHPKISSRSLAQKLITSELVRVNRRKVHKGYLLKEGDRIFFKILPSEEEIKPENIPLNIIYQDQDLVVLSKLAGMVVHPAYGRRHGTLVNGLLYRLGSLSSIGAPERPGIVHRLDRDTSGLLVVARNDQAHLALSRDVKERKVNRSYLALVHGDVFQEFGKISAPIGRHPKKRQKMAVTSQASRHAVTYFKILERLKDTGTNQAFTLLQVDLETGRTHQIRVHLSHFHHPVVGDPQYGYKKTHRTLGLKRQFLHAYKLGFKHPCTGKTMAFTDRLPPDLTEVLRRLNSKSIKSLS